jgi:hypothetical protein
MPGSLRTKRFSLLHGKPAFIYNFLVGMTGGKKATAAGDILSRRPWGKAGLSALFPWIYPF